MLVKRFFIGLSDGPSGRDEKLYIEAGILNAHELIRALNEYRRFCLLQLQVLKRGRKLFAKTMSVWLSYGY